MSAPSGAAPLSNRVRRALRRIGTSQRDLEDEELQEDVAATRGCIRIADVADRERVRLAGTLRHVTLQPRSGTPALEAELYDGSGCVTLVWLGRRRIVGIQPGRSLLVEGRLAVNKGAFVIYNPRYELRG